MESFKNITLSNWMDSEATCTAFAKYHSKSGQFVPMSGNDFAKSILKSRLASQVPEGVRNLYEIARWTKLSECRYYHRFMTIMRVKME